MQSNRLDSFKKNRWEALIQELNTEVDPRIMRLMDHMRMVSHSLYQLNEAALTTTGLSYARFRLLMSLWISEVADDRYELNPSEISDRQGISRNTVSTLIRDLEEEGLIERHLDDADRRRFNICLTDEGRALVRDHAGHHFKAVAGCFESLSFSEQEELGRLLDKLGKNINAKRESL